MLKHFMRRNLSGSLSGKLLLLTIVFVMLAEILIFFPSMAVFRQNWLAERAQSAGLLTLAIEGVPDYQGGTMLSSRFMTDTGVTMVAQKRLGKNAEPIRQLVLGMPPENGPIDISDLRTMKTLPPFGDSLRDFFGPEAGYIMILSSPTVQGAQALEVIVPRAALKMALRDYCQRVLLLSLAISILTGLMIYAALSLIIVRPIQDLAKGLALFRADPKKRLGSHKQVKRRDEIGQLEREFVDMKEGVRSALTQQERLATIGMAMAKINHDLRNVLTSAQLISDRLATDPEERVRKMGNRLVKAVARGVKLCEATLTFSQSVEERPNPQKINVRQALEQVAKHSNFEPWISFDLAVDPALSVMVDVDHFDRIFDNLFRNAAQAMPENLALVMRQNETGIATPAKMHLSVSAILEGGNEKGEDGGKVFIFVRDRGAGLPPKAQEHLFQAFTSSVRKGGTGLGLTISRELARAQGGNLRLEETGPHGTVFVVELPVSMAKKFIASKTAAS